MVKRSFLYVLLLLLSLDFLICLKKGKIEGEQIGEKNAMNVIETFKNKKVLVLGLAKSGESAARLLDRLGAIVTVNDGKAFEENPAAQSLLEEGIKL